MHLKMPHAKFHGHFAQESMSSLCRNVYITLPWKGAAIEALLLKIYNFDYFKLVFFGPCADNTWKNSFIYMMIIKKPDDVWVFCLMLSWLNVSSGSHYSDVKMAAMASQITVI